MYIYNLNIDLRLYIGKMSTSASHLELFQLFKHHEEELVEALSNIDLLSLSHNLLEIVVITKETEANFASLDHDKINSRTRARYLLHHTFERIKNGNASYSNLMRALTGADLRTRHVVQSIDDKLARQSLTAGPNIGSGVACSFQLEDHDLPVLMESLVKCAHQWEVIGIALGLPTEVLEECRNGSCNKVKLYRVLTKWITHAKSTTLESLITVLSSYLVGERKVALDLEKRYGEVTNQASVCVPQLIQPDSILPFRLVYQSCNTEIADHKSVLLEVKVCPTKFVSYQWMKDGKSLSESPDFCGTSTEILFINQASLGTEGDYYCQVTCGSNQWTSSLATLTVTYPPDKKCLLDLYSSWNEIPQNPWPLVNASIFIDPALIKIKNIQNRQHSLFMQGKMESILETMEKVEYLNVFHEYERGALMLVEGRSGSGKTTLAHRLVKDWTRGTVLKNVDNVFLVSLRKKCSKVIDILELFNDKQSEMLVGKLELSNGANACFILDGYDEYTPNHKDKSVIDQLIQKTYLPLAMIIVTSRPMATLELRQRANVTVEILGFTKEQFDRYVGSYPFECASKDNLPEFLKAFSNVVNICYLPINASIICFLYSQQFDELPKTETQIYEKFTEAIILRTLRLSNPSAQSVKDLIKRENEYFGQICLLAFNMTTENSQIAHGLPLPLKSLNTTPFSGLLTTDHIMKQCDMENVFTFLHLTLQEYLAAYHLSNLDEGEQIEMIRLHRGKPHMLTTFKFFCGLISFEYKMYQFAEITKSVGPDCLYMVHCAYESQQPDVCRRAIKLLNGRVFLSWGTYTPADFIALGYVVSTASQQVVDFRISPCILYEDSVSELWKNREMDLQDSPLTLNASEFLTDIAACMDDLVFSRVSYNTGLQYLYSSYKLKNFYARFWNNIIASNNKTIIEKCLKNVTWPYSVNNCFASDIMEPLANALKWCNRLHTLEIVNYSDKDARIVADILKYSKKYFHTLTLSSGDMTLYGTSILFKGLKFCKNIQKLDFSCCVFNPATITALAKGIMHCASLKILNLTNCEIGTKGAITLGNGIKTLSLQELYISGNCIGHEGTLALARNCLKTIRLLDLSSNNLRSEGVIALTNEIKKRRSNLITLKLAYNNIDLSGIEALEGLNTCPNLQTLCIAFNGIDSDGTTALISGLKANKSIQILSLNNNKLCSHGVTILADGLRYWRSIKTLDLSDNKLSSEGMPALATGLQLLKNLEVLHLSQNQIDCRGAKDLARGIKRSPILHTLNLCINRIGSVGAIALAEAFHCGKINYLNLSHNVIGPESTVALVALIRHGHLQVLDLSYNKMGSQSVKQLLTFQESCEHPPMLNLLANNAPEVSKASPIELQMKLNVLL